MSSIRKISILLFCITIILGVSLILDSCSLLTNDSCEEIICENGAGCLDGICHCPVTTSGENCEIEEPIDVEFKDVLLENARGSAPCLKGGIDLYTGKTVSCLSEDASFIDCGVDSLGNWRQQILNTNCWLRVLSQDQLDAGFNYSEVHTKIEIIKAWDLAENVLTHEHVELGEVFIINQENDYFLIQCVFIENTLDNNFDKFKFDIKQALL